MTNVDHHHMNAPSAATKVDLQFRCSSHFHWSPYCTGYPHPGSCKPPSPDAHMSTSHSTSRSRVVPRSRNPAVSGSLLVSRRTTVPTQLPTSKTPLRSPRCSLSTRLQHHQDTLYDLDQVIWTFWSLGSHCMNYSLSLLCTETGLSLEGRRARLNKGLGAGLANPLPQFLAAESGDKCVPALVASNLGPRVRVCQSRSLLHVISEVPEGFLWTQVFGLELRPV